MGFTSEPSRCLTVVVEGDAGAGDGNGALVFASAALHALEESVCAGPRGLRRKGWRKAAKLAEKPLASRHTGRSSVNQPTVCAKSPCSKSRPCPSTSTHSGRVAPVASLNASFIGRLSSSRYQLNEFGFEEASALQPACAKAARSSSEGRVSPQDRSKDTCVQSSFRTWGHNMDASSPVMKTCTERRTSRTALAQVFSSSSSSDAWRAKNRNQGHSMSTPS